MSIHIHIGAHKTASTELQQSLDAARGPLAASGLAYLGPMDLRAPSLGFHEALREAALSEPGDLQGYLDALTGDYPDRLISDENSIGTMSGGAAFRREGLLYSRAVELLTRLLDLLDASTGVNLFLAVRDPAEFITACYGHQLRCGEINDISSFTHGVRPRDLAWSELASRLIAMPQVSSLICWRHEDYALLRQQVLDAMVGKARSDMVSDIGWSNPGISHQAYEHFMAAIIAGAAGPLEDLMAQAIDLYPKLPDSDPLRVFDPGIYRRSADAYDADMVRLAAIEGVVLLRPDAGLQSTSPDAQGDPAA